MMQAASSPSSPSDATLNKYCLEYSYAELLTSTGNFDASHELGKGSYGAVYRGVQKDGTDIAVKVLNLPDESGFEEEVRVLSKFRHPNLVILMGFARKDATRFLVYELLAGGDVYQRLQKSLHQDQAFSWKERIAAVFGASCGLSHLHHATPKVFHRDIKTANILLDRNGSAKMADFGLSCLSHSISQKVATAAGTTGYACPLYAQRSVVTEGSEVYSFGMVLFEVLTAIAPAVLQQSSDGSLHYKFLVCDIQGSIDNAVAMTDPRGHWPLEAAHAVANLALRCADDKEEHRPNFAEVVNQLRTLRDYEPLEAEDLMRGGRRDTWPMNTAVYRQIQPAQLVAQPAVWAAQQPVAQIAAQPIAQTPMQMPAQVHLPAQQPVQLPAQLPNQVAAQALGQVVPLLPQHQRQAAQMMALWSLKCVFAENPAFGNLAQDALAITQWQEIGCPLATTLHIGRLFQEPFFNTLLSASNNLVSREHFQIWAEPLEASGTLEASSMGIPCAFFLTNFSTNGTIVNSVHINGTNGQVEIHNGDMISIPRMITAEDGLQLTSLIQFQFDLAGSPLRDAS